MNEALLTIKQLAARLNISTRAIYRLKDAGRMPQPIRLGRALRWRADELEAWVQGGCKPCDPRRTSGKIAP